MPAKLNSQGSVVITIFLTLVVIIGVVFVYYYYTQLTSLGPPPLPLVNTAPTPNDETANWKPYEDLTIGISLKIPTDWYVSSDNKFISQFPFDPKSFSSADVYNVFYISQTNLQLQSGYTNEDWLNRIDSLKPGEKLTNEFRPATNVQLVKLGSGQTADGNHFVLFKNIALDEGVTADFEKNEIIYQIILQHYDQSGIDTFQKIVSTAVLMAPTASPN